MGRMTRTPMLSRYTSYIEALHRSTTAGPTLNRPTMSCIGLLKRVRVQSCQGEPGNAAAAIGRGIPPSSHGGRARRKAPMGRRTWRLVTLQ